MTLLTRFKIGHIVLLLEMLVNAQYGVRLKELYGTINRGELPPIVVPLAVRDSDRSLKALAA
jgi:hypothetical protein